MLPPTDTARRLLPAPPELLARAQAQGWKDETPSVRLQPLSHVLTRSLDALYASVQWLPQPGKTYDLHLRLFYNKNAWPQALRGLLRLARPLLPQALDQLRPPAPIWLPRWLQRPAPGVITLPARPADWQDLRWKHEGLRLKLAHAEDRSHFTLRVSRPLPLDEYMQWAQPDSAAPQAQAECQRLLRQAGHPLAGSALAVDFIDGQAGMARLIAPDGTQLLLTFKDPEGVSLIAHGPDGQFTPIVLPPTP